MYCDIQEIRALLLQFDRSDLKDLYFHAGDWAIFMARPDGSANPLLRVTLGGELDVHVRPATASAPHLGLFEPACAPGQVVEKGGVLGVIDVLGRRTDVLSDTGGKVTEIFVANNALVEFGDRLVELEIAI